MSRKPSSDGVRVDRLTEIRLELQTMSEAEVRVLQLLVEERLAQIVESLPAASKKQRTTG